MVVIMIDDSSVDSKPNNDWPDFCVFFHFFSENFVILFTVEASSNITIFNEIELFQTRHIPMLFFSNSHKKFDFC